MNAGAASRRVEPAPGLEDVLDQLTTTHSSMVERFGEIVGERCPPPDEPVAYAAKAARLAAAIDSATDPAEKRVALLSSEAARHEQLGRLGLYIADYQAEHGDPGHAPAMRELGRDHLDLAAGLRGTLDDEQAQQRDGGMEQSGLPGPGAPMDVLVRMERISRARLDQVFRDDDLIEWGRRNDEIRGMIVERAKAGEAIPADLRNDLETNGLLADPFAAEKFGYLTVEGIAAEPMAALQMAIPDEASQADLVAAYVACGIIRDEVARRPNRTVNLSAEAFERRVENRLQEIAEVFRERFAPDWEGGPDEAGFHMDDMVSRYEADLLEQRTARNDNARREGKTVDEQKHPVEVEWDAETAQREALNRWPKAPDTPATIWPGTQEEENALCAARTVARHRYGTLTVAAIEADPVAALYLGMPERPTEQLVQAAHFAAQMVENWHDMDDPKYSELVEAAYTRRDELSNYKTYVQSWGDLQGEQRAAWRFAMSEAYPGVAAWIDRHQAEKEKQEQEWESGTTMKTLTAEAVQKAEQFGPMHTDPLFKNPEAPAEYAEKVARLQAAVETATGRAEKELAELSLEEATHEQAGRLAGMIGRYAAHHQGDNDLASDMQNLACKHLLHASNLREALAEERPGLRETAEREWATRSDRSTPPPAEKAERQDGGGILGLVSPETIAQARADWERSHKPPDDPPPPGGGMPTKRPGASLFDLVTPQTHAEVEAEWSRKEDNGKGPKGLGE